MNFKESCLICFIHTDNVCVTCASHEKIENEWSHMIGQIQINMFSVLCVSIQLFLWNNLLSFTYGKTFC